MFRFYIDRAQIKDDQAVITGEDVNHMKNVLRMRPGDGILLCDGRGRVYDATIKEVGAEQIVCFVTKEGISDTELPVKLVLYQGLPKRDKMEWIIQKAVELGVSEIVPVQMARTIVKLEDKKKEEKKLARWRSIVEGAAKQSGRGYVPTVCSLLSFQEAIKHSERLAYRMIPYEKAENLVESRTVMQEASKAQSVGIFIGPEGGIAEEEIQDALSVGVKPVSLGRRILRTETAGLTALSILMFEIETENR